MRRCRHIQPKINFAEDALKAIAEKAIKAGTGARALRMILENIMRDLMFDIPSDSDVTEVEIFKEVVTEGAEPTVKRKSDAKKIA